jgi:phosphocarrier protein HPr
MLEVQVVLSNRLGLHARAAAQVVRAAKDFESSIMLVGEDDARADGKSILSILALAAGKGTRITLAADGPDEANAIQELQRLFANNFDEEQ